MNSVGECEIKDLDATLLKMLGDRVDDPEKVIVCYQSMLTLSGEGKQYFHAFILTDQYVRDVYKYETAATTGVRTIRLIDVEGLEEMHSSMSKSIQINAIDGAANPVIKFHFEDDEQAEAFQGKLRDACGRLGREI